MSKKWIGNVRAQCVTADGGAENVAMARFRNGSRRMKMWKRNRCNHLSIGSDFDNFLRYSEKNGRENTESRQTGFIVLR